MCFVTTWSNNFVCNKGNDFHKMIQVYLISWLMVQLLNSNVKKFLDQWNFKSLHRV